jgi:hypothetical protein
MAGTGAVRRACRGGDGMENAERRLCSMARLLRHCAFACLLPFGFVVTQGDAAQLGGAYFVDDAEIGPVGSCEVESWASFAGNSDV